MGEAIDKNISKTPAKNQNASKTSISRPFQQIYIQYYLQFSNPNPKNQMKIRAMKLREAHKSDDSCSLCSVLWASNGDHIVTSSSSDNAICIHDAITPSNAPKFLRNHREGVTALALSPNSTCLASGSIDHSVKIYKFPGIFSSSFYF